MDFILEDIDWRKILIRRYKNYHLNENDLAVILLINELNRGVPHLISPEEIVPYTTMNAEQIEQIMSKLLKAGYASIEGVSFSVNAIKKKIFDDTVKEASKGYFNKEPINLNDSEATMLAGIPNAPSVYAPTQNLKLAKQRQKQVLEQMCKYGKLKEEDANRILETGNK